MKTANFQMFNRKIRFTVDSRPPAEDYDVYWVAMDINGRPVTSVNIDPDILRPENHDRLLNGLIHELFEIGSWINGYYDVQTKKFRGFTHDFYEDCITKSVQTALKVMARLCVFNGKRISRKGG